MEFDPGKDSLNREKHGVSLAKAGALDLATALVLEDDRADYGEKRYLAFGVIERRWFAFVFTIRDGVVRAISLRPANRKERKRHGLSALR